MKLQSYEWFHNPRGLANNGPYRPLDVSRYLQPHIGWASLNAGGDEYVDEAAVLVENSCMPVVRIYRTDMGASSPSEDWYDIYRAYIDAGSRWFELYSAPNLPAEWPRGEQGFPEVWLSWENREECIQPLMDNWLTWAERIIALGGYPAFPALASSAERTSSTVYWIDAFLTYLREAHFDRFRAVAQQGLWCATQPQLHNHFYQETPDSPSHIALPHYQQNAGEPGWHFEYPYDPIMQRYDSQRTVFGSAGDMPFGDPFGLIAAGQAFQELLFHRLDMEPVPVLAISSGIHPIPQQGEDAVCPDALYPSYDRSSHAEATLAMWRWIVEDGPPWLFGVTLHNEAEYYDKQGIVPAIEKMVSEPPILKVFDEGLPELVRDETVSAHEPVVDAPPAPEADQPEPGEIIEGHAEIIEPSEPDTPVWLEGLVTDDEPLGDVAGLPDIPEESFSELPDEPQVEDEISEAVPPWLAGLVDDSDEAPAPEPDADDVPPWLVGVAIGESAAPESVTPLSTSIEEEPLPEVPFETSVEPLSGKDIPVPLWLGGAVQPVDAPEIDTPSPVKEPITVEVMETPDWLKDSNLFDEKLHPPEEKPQPAPVEETSEEVLALVIEDVPPEPVAEYAAEEVPGEQPVSYPSELAHHWLIFAPDFDAGWFFNVGQRYWQMFRPTVALGWGLLLLLADEPDVVATVLVSTESADRVESQITAAWPGVWVDVIMADTIDDLRYELAWRVRAGKPLGD